MMGKSGRKLSYKHIPFLLIYQRIFVMSLLKHNYCDDVCRHELQALKLSDLCERGGDLLGSYECGQLVE
jgi:hypothetical protein